jgi:hypothetical protein
VARVAVELDERTGIEQPLEPLAREQLAGLTLALDSLRARGVQRFLAELLEPLELRLGRLLRSGTLVGCRHRPEPTSSAMMAA